MLFAIRFVDKADSLPLRQQRMAAHIAWLDQEREHVLVGGSLRHSPEQAPVGGLWVVEAQSKAAAEALLKQDPFYSAGLRESWEILHWSKAFEDRKVPV
ncbi:YciI family protein [Paucibacter sp. B2R-40]|uniref:YciI family protein n=1 Tax=Paucibacter sp. B2R-40 TaxID=2893554 RepID=UPI0021E4F321|nr:YciI family protein [Paucibacter sp. B2R-40]MCV2357024.1 YciI family protein [Paucibacter sp. B2R-40]